MTFRRIDDPNEARALMAKATYRRGHEIGVASGTFQMGYRLPDGSELDHYLNFGWRDAWFLYAPNHVEPPVNKIIDRMRDC